MMNEPVKTSSYTRSNSSSSLSSYLSNDMENSNNVHRDLLTSVDTGNTSVETFLASLLLEDDESDSFDSNRFICVKCQIKFRSGGGLIRHVNDAEQHHLVRFSKINEAQRFILDKLDTQLFRSIVVLLVEKRVKIKFLQMYANDLLVANEEIALCLEELNRCDEEECEENESLDENNNNNSSSSSCNSGSSSICSLLFIDYSIIQFNRVINILIDMYKRLNSVQSNNTKSVVPVIPIPKLTTSSVSSATLTTSSTTSVKSSAASNGHQQQQHSRNACKKLKCPKCNWHYKYHETLDIHMREKHPAELNSNGQPVEQCIYCAESLPHPRLGRGEQYKCGYKPYRCDICDYSTTTKGNLSIHMQSDKHVNNVKEFKEKTGGGASSSSPALSGSKELAGEIDTTAANIHLLVENNSNNNKNSVLSNNSGSGAVNTKKIKDIYTSTYSLTSINGLNESSLKDKQSTENKTSSGKTTNEQTTPIIILCPLCQTPYAEQDLLESHLKESHSVKSHEAIRILLSTAQKLSSSESTESINETDNLTIDNNNNSLYYSLGNENFKNSLSSSRQSNTSHQHHHSLQTNRQTVSQQSTVNKMSAASSSTGATSNTDSTTTNAASSFLQYLSSHYNDYLLNNTTNSYYAPSVASANTGSDDHTFDSFIRSNPKLYASLLRSISVRVSRVADESDENKENDDDDEDESQDEELNDHLQQLSCNKCSTCYDSLDQFKSHFVDVHNLSSERVGLVSYKLIARFVQKCMNENDDLLRQVDSGEKGSKSQLMQKAVMHLADSMCKSTRLASNNTTASVDDETSGFLNSSTSSSHNSSSAANNNNKRSNSNNSRKSASNKQHHLPSNTFLAESLVKSNNTTNNSAKSSLTNGSKNNKSHSFNNTSLLPPPPVPMPPGANGSNPLLNQLLFPLMLSQSPQMAAAAVAATLAAQAAAFAPTSASSSSNPVNNNAAPIPSVSSPATTTPCIDMNSEDSMNNSDLIKGGSGPDLSFDGNRRRRTRITEDQLKVLRQYFDINKSPPDEAIVEIARQTQLPSKVIKHWFRNTLFKERQKDKDSPYNFNNPPITQLNLEEYEKTGKIVSVEVTTSQNGEDKASHDSHEENNMIKVETEEIKPDHDQSQQQIAEEENEHESAGGGLMNSLLSPSHTNNSDSNAPSSSGTSMSGNRTKFTDKQIKKLQEVFRTQKYPKDDELNRLARQLGLKPRVITVWFQNARQKARRRRKSSSSSTSKNNNNRQDEYEENEIDLNDEENYFDDCDNQSQQSAASGDHESSVTSNVSKQQSSIKQEDSENQHQQAANAFHQLAMSLLSAHQQQQQQMSDNVKKEDEIGGEYEDEDDDEEDYSGEESENDDTSGNRLKKRRASSSSSSAPTTISHRNGNLIPQLSSFAHPLLSNSQSSMLMSLGNSLNASSHANSTVHHSNNSSSGSNNSKRLRTTILPEQQEYLMQKYQLDQNPSRKMLDEIAREVRLKKRVVQVWFQNTRARERKGIIKVVNTTSSNSNSSSNNNPVSATTHASSSTPTAVQANKSPLSSLQASLPQQQSKLATTSSNTSSSPSSAGLNNTTTTSKSKLCPLCSNVTATVSFKTKSELEAHLCLKHNYTYEQASSFDFDMFPDATSTTDLTYNKQQSTSSGLSSSNLALQNLYSSLFLPPTTTTTPNSPAASALSHLPFSAASLFQNQSQQMNPMFMSGLLAHLAASANQQPNLNNGYSSKMASEDGASNSTLLLAAAAAAAQQQQQQQSQALADLAALSSKLSSEKVNQPVNKSTSSPSPNSKSNGTSLITAAGGLNGGSSNLSSNSSTSSSSSSCNQRRVRTQMSQQQVNVMRLMFSEYKTPTMTECELMGREINLKKRVVQVWFQNARAKEKKNSHGNGGTRSILFSNSAQNDLSQFETSPDECLICHVKYNVKTNGVAQTQREHLFSKQHLNALVQYVKGVASENGVSLSNGDSKSCLFNRSNKSNANSNSNSSSHNNTQDEEMLDYDENHVDYVIDEDGEDGDNDLLMDEVDDDTDNNEDETQETKRNETTTTASTSEHDSDSTKTTGSMFDLNRILQQQSGGVNSSQQQMYNYLLYSNLLGGQQQARASPLLVNMNSILPSTGGATASTSSPSLSSASSASSSSSITPPINASNHSTNTNLSALAQLYAAIGAGATTTPSLLMPFDQLGLPKQVKADIEQKLLLLDPTSTQPTIQYSTDQTTSHAEAQKRLASPELLMLVGEHALSQFYMCRQCHQVSLTREAFLAPQHLCHSLSVVKLEQTGYKCLPCWSLWNTMSGGGGGASSDMSHLQQCCMFASFNEYLEHAVKYGHISMANLLLMKRKEELIEQQQQNAMSTFLQAMAAVSQAKTTPDTKKFKY